MFDPLLPLGCGELWIGEVVQTEAAAPLCLCRVQQLLSRFICVCPAIDEEVYGR